MGVGPRRKRNTMESVSMGLDHMALIHIHTTEESREFCFLHFLVLSLHSSSLIWFLPIPFDLSGAGKSGP